MKNTKMSLWNTTIKCIIIFFILLLLSQTASAYNVSGYIENSSGTPIRNVLIENNVTSIICYTNTTGYYIVSLGDGNYNLVGSKTGYITSTHDIIVSGGDINNINITLDEIYTDYEFAYNTLISMETSNNDITGWIFILLLVIDFSMIIFFFRGNVRGRLYGDIVIGMLTIFLSFMLSQRSLLEPVEMPDLSIFLSGIAVVMVIFTILAVVEIVKEGFVRGTSER